MNELRIPYPDFKLGEVIDPEQHDLNNGYIQVKVNEIVDFANEILTVGGSQIPIVPPADFTATNIQALFDEIIARLKSTVAGASGAKLIGTPALNRIAGTDVETQLKFINDLLQTSFVISSLIADGAVITSKIADGAVISAKLGAGSVTFEKLADGSVTATKIVNGSVVTDKIGNFAVTTPKISDGAVTESKLGTSSVGTLNIKDGNVTGVKIANRTITGSKVGLSTILLENLAPEVLAVVPQSMLTARVIALEGDVAELDLAIAAIDAGLEETMANVNTPNNLVKLTNSGKIPNALLPVNHYVDGIVTETTGVANEYIISLQVPLVSYEKGQRLTVFFNVNNTGASTVKINNLPVVGLKKNDGSDFGSGDLKVGSPYTFVYNGTAFFSDSGGGGEALVEYINYNTGVKVAQETEPPPLSTPMLASAGSWNNNYAIFSGGTSGGNPQRVVNTYNKQLVREIQTQLPIGISYHMGGRVGDYGIIAGGDSTAGVQSAAYVYDDSLIRTTISPLSTARANGATVSNGEYLIFAGGNGLNLDPGSAVDAYSKDLVRTTIDRLPSSRNRPVGANAGKYMLITGGQTSSGATSQSFAYDESLVRTSIANLSQARANFTSATVGGNAILFGGASSSAVDNYDSSLVKTNLANLPSFLDAPGGVSLPEFAIFGGGVAGSSVTTTAYSYDSSLIRETTQPLALSVYFPTRAIVGDYALLSGGYGSVYSNRTNAYKQIVNGGIIANEGDKYKFPDDVVEQTAPSGGIVISYPYRVDGYVKVVPKKLTN